MTSTKEEDWFFLIVLERKKEMVLYFLNYKDVETVWRLWTNEDKVGFQCHKLASIRRTGDKERVNPREGFCNHRRTSYKSSDGELLQD